MRRIRLVHLRVLAAIAVVSAVVVACSDTAPAPTGPIVAGTSSLQVAQLASCPGTPYDSTTRVIGIRGGTIKVGRGTFTVPPGAVLLPTAITMVQPADSALGFRFSPEGMLFVAAQPTLQVDYGSCEPGTAAAPQIVYVGQSGLILELLNSTVLTKRLVEAKIFHFSRYAVAW